jgi:ribose/xylose/arabinose/galactoside ABC-type transport system permease subunit
MTGAAREAEREPSPGGGVGERLAKYLRTLGITLSLLLLFGYFSFATDGAFHREGNLKTMASQAVIPGLGAVGMTLVIISGGIDLSVGSAIALSMVACGWCIHAGASLWLSALAGLSTGVLAGFANGAMITGFRIVPFIATLGMMGIARGLAKLVAKSQQINIDFPDWPQSWLAQLTVSPRASDTLPDWLFFEPSVWLLLVLATAMALVLRHTVFGRHAFAIGSNEAAARLCGVRVRGMKLAIYSVAGFFTGLAGVVFCSRQSQGDPTAALGLELDIIAAVVIGGGSLSGGVGTVLGTIVGATIMSVIQIGCSQMGLPNWVQQIVTGTIIVLAVALDRWRQGIAAA